MAYNTNSLLDKLSCTNNVEFGKRQETFGRFVILYKDMDEKFKLAHKVVDVVDRANRKICVTALWYNADNSESLYAQLHFFAGKKEHEKFKQIVHLKLIFDYFFSICSM